MMTTPRYFEDFAIGQVFTSPEVELTVETIKAFAGQFDPQPFHTDEMAAEGSFFKGLAASGWHTAALTMRLLTASDLNPVNGVIGAGVESLIWPIPSRPGDRLSLRITVEDTRQSKSKPEMGFVRVLVETLNQNGFIAQKMVANLVVTTKIK
jgi:acyl dehydratase